MNRIASTSAMAALLATVACAPQLQSTTAERVGESVIVTHSAGSNPAAAETLAVDACTRIGRSARFVRQELQASGARNIYECTPSAAAVSASAPDERIILTQRPGEEASVARIAADECGRRGKTVRMMLTEAITSDMSRVTFHCITPVPVSPVSAATAPQERVLIDFAVADGTAAAQMANEECARFRKRARMSQQELISPGVNRAVYDCVVN